MTRGRSVEKAPVRPDRCEDHATDHPTEEEIDEAIKETFPASDPPGWTLGVEPAEKPVTTDRASSADARIETIVTTRVRDLVDGFKVRRVLPSAKRRMVGPFIFLDQMGPEVLLAGRGLDVAPHPHIGLATVTYLFQGELLHRDSLGTVQTIRPFEVNWMTAGSGIAHSERSPQEMRRANSRLFGLQSWVALPRKYEESQPAFAHYESVELPMAEGEGKRVRLIAGSLYGMRSPVRTLSEMFYVDAYLESNALLEVPADYEERAAYIVEGSVMFDGSDDIFSEGELLVFEQGEEILMRAAGISPAQVMLLGGEPSDGPRHIWWNFVSSSSERIEQAKRDWKEGRFAPVTGETESIPLPEAGPAIVRYP